MVKNICEHNTCGIAFTALLLLLILKPLSLNATSYYVDTTGNDINNGLSIGSPLKTITQALSLIDVGDTMFIRGGTHPYTETLRLTKIGSTEILNCMFAYPGDERPIIDFSAMSIGSSNRGISLSGNYWYIKGLRIKGAGDNGMNISGDNNIVEFCDFFENRDGGCQLGGGAQNNRILNCDSYLNADYVDGSSVYTGANADGFAPKLDCGTGNYFYGCRAWQNSDDGWDGYLSSDSDITTTIENCWTWGNGYLKDGITTNSSMNGNGFKMGGGGTTGNRFRHNAILKNCLSFNNKTKGFDQNNNVGSMTLINCSAKSNLENNFSITLLLAPGKVLTVKNCISYEKNRVSILGSAVIATNSWNIPFTVSSADFESIDTLSISGTRNSDGSLPEIQFMHLIQSSPLIDAGTDIGLPFVGNNPDLGCFEKGLSGILHTLITDIATGNGAVSPSGINKYDSSSTISVTAIPESGYYFSKWTDESGISISTENPYRVLMNEDSKTVKANFLISPKFVLYTSVPGGGGYILPFSRFVVDSATTLTLTAIPDAQYTFVSWGGDASGVSSTTTVLMNGNKTVNASFAPNKHTLLVNIVPEGSGSVSPYEGIYDYGSLVTLSNTPVEGYVFDNWTDDNDNFLSNSEYLLLTMDADKIINANFLSNTSIQQNGFSNNYFNVLNSNNSSEITVQFYSEYYSTANIILYNTLGNKIKSIEFEINIQGAQEVIFNESKLTPGIYIIALQLDRKQYVKKLVVK